MARGASTRVEISVAGHGPEDFAVVQLAGAESLSKPFRFDVDLIPVNGALLVLADLLGADCAITLRGLAGAERVVKGLVESASMTGVDGGKPRYRVRLVPRLELLRDRRNSRIFQGLSVPQIVAKVLDAAQVKHRSNLQESHEPREYVVQHRESDLDFVHRLLEFEGIAYRFDPADDVVVLCDSPGSWEPIPGEAKLPYQAPSEAADIEKVSRLCARRAVVAGAATVRDFDFVRPDVDLTARVSGSGTGERYEYPSGYTQGKDGSRIGRLRLEEEGFGSEVYDAESTTVRVAPGLRFQVEGHPDSSLDQDLVVVRLKHEARQGEAAGGTGGLDWIYSNQLEAIVATAPYRPARRTPRPRIVGLQSATVVGQAGEEIHVDDYGRIKIQFHWDRQGSRDDRSSCWVRTTQAWAGPGFGASYVPRVGQEVLVRFLDGDPDRPIVEGAVYNGSNPTPVELPAEKTQSTLRSDSSLGSEGFNELRFEDSTDGERVQLHAQRDERLEVGNDKRQRVGNDESLEVGHDRVQEVGKDQALRVVRSDASAVARMESLDVGGNRDTRTSGSHDEAIGLLQSITVQQARELRIDRVAVTSVGAANALTIGGAYAVNVGGALNIAVGGVRLEEVGGAKVEFVGARREEQIGGNQERTVGSEEDLHVGGALSVQVGKDDGQQVGAAFELLVPERADFTGRSLQIEADSLSIIVGDNKLISIDRSGTVSVTAKSITVNGSGDITLKGSKVGKDPAGGPESGSLDIKDWKRDPKDRYFVELDVKDQGGNPVTNEWYRVEFPDGTVRRGATDANGYAKVWGPVEGQCKVSLVRLDEESWR